MARRLNRFGSALPGRMRGGRFAALILAVIVVHGCVTHELANRMDSFAAAARMPPRIEVAYVRTLEPEAPPAVAPIPQAPAPRRRAARARPAKAASAAQHAMADASEAAAPDAAKKRADDAAIYAAAASDAAAADAAAAEAMVAQAASAATTAQAASNATAQGRAEAMASAASAVASSASSASASASTALATAASALAASSSLAGAANASGAEPFDWPASTRVTFVLTGNFRGEVNGNAQVEWIRVGTHYQVNLDLLVGPAFAPIITRRMTSEGELTSEGLVPSRYDEDTQVVFRERRRVSVFFQPEGVVLANGERHERWPGVQDTASQFIQLTWLFTTHPERLHVGGTVEMPLALPRKVDRWTYDVLDEVVLNTPFGPLPTFHLKPRRDTPRAGELSAEIWFSPQLRYLPVRIRIEQDPQTYLDLMIARKPDLASR